MERTCTYEWYVHTSLHTYHEFNAHAGESLSTRTSRAANLKFWFDRITLDYAVQSCARAKLNSSRRGTQFGFWFLPLYLRAVLKAYLGEIKQANFGVTIRNSHGCRIICIVPRDSSFIIDERASRLPLRSQYRCAHNTRVHSTCRQFYGSTLVRIAKSRSLTPSNLISEEKSEKSYGGSQLPFGFFIRSVGGIQRYSDD